MAEKSKMTREWVERVWRDNPCTKLDNGNIRTGPVRLAFVNVLERPKPKADGKERAYGAVLLLPDLAGSVDISPMVKAVQDLYAEKMPAALTNQALREKLHNPFKKQGGYIDTKSATGTLYDGFVDGRFCISVNSSKSKPPVVDMNGAPIVDFSRIYSGCWAIVAIKADWITQTENPGPTFYLQSVMVIADDENLGGAAGGNPQQDFAGVKIDPTVSPAGSFGADLMTSGAQPQVAAGIDLFA